MAGGFARAITGLSLATDLSTFCMPHSNRSRFGFGKFITGGSEAGHAGTEVIASGGALLRSPGWTQMIADAVGRPVISSTEQEPSSRGAALYALERLGVIGSLDALPASTGATISPRPQFEAAYQGLLADQHALFAKLFGT